jgi:hypothetical protein
MYGDWAEEKFVAEQGHFIDILSSSVPQHSSQETTAPLDGPKTGKRSFV